MTPSRHSADPCSPCGASRMIVPDLLRVVQPLGSFGFYADNDGLIYDVTGPFDEESNSSRLAGGIAGRRQARSSTRLSCTLGDLVAAATRSQCSAACEYVLPGREADHTSLAADRARRRGK